MVGGTKAFTPTFKGSWGFLTGLGLGLLSRLTPSSCAQRKAGLHSIALLKRLQTAVSEISHLPSLTLPREEVLEMRGGDPKKARGMLLRLLDLEVQMHLQKLQCPFLVEERGLPRGSRAMGVGTCQNSGELFNNVCATPAPILILWGLGREREAFCKKCPGGLAPCFSGLTLQLPSGLPYHQPHIPRTSFYFLFFRERALWEFARPGFPSRLSTCLWLSHFFTFAVWWGRIM